jgi:hypothetical protein
MALIGNHSVLNKSHAFFTNGTSTAGAYAANTKSNWIGPSYYSQRRFSIYPKTSFVEGMNLHEAYLGPWKNGGLSSGLRISGESSLSATGILARLSNSSISGAGSVSASLSVITKGSSTLLGSGSLSANVAAVSSLADVMSGAASLTANLSAIVPLASALNGAASVSANLKGKGKLESHIDVGAGTELSPENLAAAVWDITLADHVDTGSTGAALSDAGGAGNPWSADLSSNNTSGTFGWLVQKLLTVSKFLGLK